MKYAKDALDDYLHFLRVERQLSANTLVSYERDLKGYLQYLTEVEQLNSLRKVERLHILNHLRHLKEAAKTSRTVARPYFINPFVSPVFDSGKDSGR